MARTSRQLAALGVTIALALSSGSNASLSNGLGQDELGIELDGRSSSTRRHSAARAYVPHLPQQGHGTLTLADVQRIIERRTPTTRS